MALVNKTLQVSSGQYYTDILLCSSPKFSVLASQYILVFNYSLHVFYFSVAVSIQYYSVLGSGVQHSA